jgi:hypothetical protein
VDTVLLNLRSSCRALDVMLDDKRDRGIEGFRYFQRSSGRLSGQQSARASTVALGGIRMTRSLSRWLPRFAMLVVFATAPTIALGQSTSERWPGLASSQLQTVYVLDRSGVETTGKLLGLSPDSLVLLVADSERRFDRADVARIQKRDSLKNGTLIGAAVGVAMGLVAAGISDCPGTHPGGACPGFRAATVVASTGVYAALGVGVDALIRGRTTLYEARSQSPRRPALGPATAGGVAAVAVSW